MYLGIQRKQECFLTCQTFQGRCSVQFSYSFVEISNAELAVAFPYQVRIVFVMPEILMDGSVLILAYYFSESNAV